MTVPCLMTAWTNCEAELRGYLRHRVGRSEDADDLLQEVFIKGMRQGEQFCAIGNPRAWLFQVARNTLTDRLRLTREHLPLPEDLAALPEEAHPPVDDLSQCLPRVLSELSEADRLAITLCDIEGGSQQELADCLGISLSGAKSRIQRARRRLKDRMKTGCQIQFNEHGDVCCFTPRPPL
jgi:RNA polymerase sigma-70 factor (ECF subfamily)